MIILSTNNNSQCQQWRKPRKAKTDHKMAAKLFLFSKLSWEVCHYFLGVLYFFWYPLTQYLMLNRDSKVFVERSSGWKKVKLTKI